MSSLTAINVTMTEDEKEDDDGQPVNPSPLKFVGNQPSSDWWIATRRTLETETAISTA